MPSASPEVSAKSTAQFRGLAGITLWLYPLFFLSGISGLVYEVVWVRMLTRILGSTVYATSTVLAAFMAGLAVGSFLFGRFVDRTPRPLRWYAFLEIAIGLTALCTLSLPNRLIPLYQSIYAVTGGARAALTAGQVLVALIVLLVPTALMGATLPTLCAYGGQKQENFGRTVGLLYGLNTLGAVTGVLASGFFLIGEWGETLTVYLAVALNLLVGLAAWWLPLRSGEYIATLPRTAKSVRAGGVAGAEALYSPIIRWTLLGCFAVSGFTSLANEVVWSRMLVLYQGTSIYAFSSMLAVVLAGMGAGSFLGGILVGRWRDPLRLMARLQIAIGVAAVAALHLYSRQSAGLFMPPFILLGPLGLLWGLTFPVGAACYAGPRHSAGRSIAELYSWNTVGCIAGSLAAGFLLIPLLGSSLTGIVLAGCNLLLGVALLWVHPAGGAFRARADWVLAAVGIVFLVQVGDPYFRVVEQKMEQLYPGQVDLYRHFEESAATTTAFGRRGGDFDDKQLWVNGYGMTILLPVTKLMAHLPLALVNDPHDILVICFGMGTTARSASRHEGIQVHVVELVGAVLRCFDCFHADAHEVLAQSNVHTAVDDGRNYLLMHPQEYDVITIDPPPPLHSAGAVNLYTREFFQLCRDRLRPGGVLAMWIPPDSLSEVKMITRSFLDVFEHVNGWAGPPPLSGILLLGSGRPLQHVREKVRQMYELPAVAADLREWGPELDHPDKVLQLYLADKRELSRFVAGVPLITDDSPYTEFPLWRARQAGGEYSRQFSAAGFQRYLIGSSVAPRAPE